MSGISKDKTIAGQRAGSLGKTVTSKGTKGCGTNENCGRFLECGVCCRILNMSTIFYKRDEPGLELARLPAGWKGIQLF